MKWVRPVERNDWGSITVHAGEPAMTPHGTLDSDLTKVPVITYGNYHFKWPDGTVEVLAVHMREYRTTVGDMGNDREVRSMVPYVLVNHHGSAIQLDLRGSMHGLSIGVDD